MKLLKILVFLSLAGATVTDIDGNVYETVQIGDQLWMAENLKVTHYRNGDEIPTGLDNSAWSSTEEGAYAVYDNYPANAETYGRLYNWYAVDDNRGICPEGFHVPTDDEFTILIEYLGSNPGSQLAGTTDLWSDGNLDSNTDFGTSGFNGLPGGFCSEFGIYNQIGYEGYFWSSTESNSIDAWDREFYYFTSNIHRGDNHKNFGFSIRCLADEVITGFQPQTKEELQTAVNLWVSDEALALETYGEINNWNTSLITDMSYLFQDIDPFNDEINNWDVSNVVDMEGMFMHADSFNQDISSWNVSNVTNMTGMFMHALSFINDLSSWNVSSVTDMSYMFMHAHAGFNGNINSWGNISSWNVSSVTNMSHMFTQASNFNQDISSWDVSNVTDMSYMFFYASSFNQDISSLDVSSVTDMYAMFDGTDVLSDENKCAIDSAWDYSEAWEYDWSELCSLCSDGYSEIEGNCYNSIDLAVLQDIIDINESLVGQEILEFGWTQDWDDSGNLNYLDISFYELTIIPESIGNFYNIEYLYLSNNQLTSIPESIGELTNLKGLYLFNNQLTLLPENIGSLNNLINLQLSINQIVSLPDGIWNLYNLETLFINHNQISSLSESIGNLSNLQSLFIEYNQLSVLPESIGNLINMNDLRATGNFFTSIPDTINNLNNLGWLQFDSNLLTNIPECIGNLDSLEWLFLNNNQLNLLPESICNLDFENMEAYNFSDNNICPPYPSCLTEENMGYQTCYGCTDPLALNYNPNATSNDGSCYYCEGENPQGCIYTGCPADEECIIIDCYPSFCECNEEYNNWSCLQDCDGGVCVEIVDSPLGDINYDGSVNITDIIYMVNLILDDLEPSADELWAADINDDGMINIVDVINVVAEILNSTTETVADIDGNIYQTVQIGNQLWMAENLKVTHYNNGDEIPNNLNNSEWANTSNGATAVYSNNESNAETYGRIYNWYAINDNRGICPDGWHLPSDNEFMILEMFLGMTEYDANEEGWRGTNEGSKLAGNSDLWDDGELENNSEFGTSGFNALPAGYRSFSNGNYISIGYAGYFWSSSENNSDSSWRRRLGYDNSEVVRVTDDKQDGFSVRCVGD